MSSRATSVRHTGSRLGERRADRAAPEQFGDRSEREAAFGLVRARSRRRHAARIGPRQRFLCEARLADAGVTGNQDERRRSRTSPLPRSDNLRPFVGASDEWRRRRGIGCGAGGAAARRLTFA